MSGREERNDTLRRSIENILDAQPDYLTYFYESLTDILPHTQRSYIVLIVKFFNQAFTQWGLDPWDEDDLVRITPMMIQRWLFEMEGQSGSKNNMYFALKKFFSFLASNEYIPQDPMLNIRKPKSPKINDAVALTPEETKIVFSNIKHPELTNKDDSVSYREMCIRKRYSNRNLAIVSLALTSGIRSSSLLEIDLDDVDFDKGTIQIVQKGDRYHTVYLSENTEKYLKAWLEERKEVLRTTGKRSDALFLGMRGDRFSYKEFKKLLDWATYGIDKKITTHKLRSTCATNLYDKTKDLNLTARVLGHTNVDTTRRYIHVEAEKERSAINGLGEIFE